MRQFARVGCRVWIVILMLLPASSAAFAGGDLPVLAVDGKETISLDFEDATVASVLDAIGSVGKLHFIFDEKVDLEAKTSVRLSEVSIIDALRYFLEANRMFHVVRRSDTVLVAPDTREKRQQHMPMITRTFELEQADVRNVITVLRSLLQSRQITLDEERNILTMTDTPGQIDIASEILERIDRTRDEVLDDAARDEEPLWVGSDHRPGLRMNGETVVPQLELDMDSPLTIGAGERTVRRIYETLGRKTGIEFLYDRKIDLDRSVSVSLPDASARELLDLIDARLGHISVVWGPRTVFVAPDERWDRAARQHVAIRFFYLVDSEPRSIVTAMRAHLQSRRVVEVPHLNAVLVRDDLATLDAAADLVESLDVPPPDRIPAETPSRSHDDVESPM